MYIVTLVFLLFCPTRVLHIFLWSVKPKLQPFKLYCFICIIMQTYRRLVIKFVSPHIIIPVFFTNVATTKLNLQHLNINISKLWNHKRKLFMNNFTPFNYILFHILFHIILCNILQEICICYVYNLFYARSLVLKVIDLSPQSG